MAVASSLTGCNAPVDGALEPVESTEEAWSVASCGRETTIADHTFNGFINVPANPNFQFVSPTTYNNCTRSYVVDIDNLSASYVGPGGGGGPAAHFTVAWADAVPTNAADCARLVGGAIIYVREQTPSGAEVVAASGSGSFPLPGGGAGWVAITGQVSSPGQWVSGPFGGASCVPPSVTFYNITAGDTYRIAATMRDGSGATRKVGLRTEPPITIR